LKAHGIRPGPIYGELLAAVRKEQLEGRLVSPQAALEWALQRYTEGRAAEE
jgi:hypothetical protein